MALSPRFSICNDSTCENITVTDITGLYDASTNTGGYGSPNDGVGDVTSVTLTITPPSGTALDAIDIVGGTPHANVTWPASDLVYFDFITLAAEDLGGTAGAAISDGTYTFLYTITGPGGTVTQTREHYLHCVTTACVQGLFANLEIGDCSCDTAAVDKAIYAWSLHEALRSAVNCSKRQKIVDIQAALTKICNNTNDCDGC
jgi:hypothetical protein